MKFIYRMFTPHMYPRTCAFTRIHGRYDQNATSFSRRLRAPIASCVLVVARASHIVSVAATSAALFIGDIGMEIRVLKV